MAHSILASPIRSQSSATGCQFDQSSDLLEMLGRVIFEVPFTDLQDAIGKSGASKIPSSMSKLSLWIRSS
jgi:hypothetical protein